MGYDLMIRGVHLDASKITLTIIIVSIVSEIVRNIMRIVAVARIKHAEIISTGPWDQRQRHADIKEAIRLSFEQAKDELVRFITYTTFLLFVFLLFPRLKLLSMVIASVTSLGLDLAFPTRLHGIKGTDLISRILSKVFRI